MGSFPKRGHGSEERGGIGDGLDSLGLFLSPRRGEKTLCGTAKKHLSILAGKKFVAEFGEEQVEVSLVAGFSGRVDNDIVDADGAELVILLEKEIHCPQDSGGRVAEAKGHAAELEGVIAGLEGGALAVLGDDLDLVEPTPEVHFGEHP